MLDDVCSSSQKHDPVEQNCHSSFRKGLMVWVGESALNLKQSLALIANELLMNPGATSE
jgi:hypothetical protein